MALFTPKTLSAWLQYPEQIAEDTVEVVEMVVAGWILGATGWASVPAEDALPAPLKAWALELGGIAYENPTSQTDDQTDLVRSAWRDRRSQILAEIRAWAQSNGTIAGSTPAPRGSFPKPLPYPDPTYPFGMRP